MSRDSRSPANTAKDAIYDESLDNPTERVEVAAVRAGENLDWSALSDYLVSTVPGLQGDFQVLQFPNGNANLTYLVSFGDRRLVVRRRPFGTVAAKAHDMHREYRVLVGLQEAYPCAPDPVLFCDDESIIGAPFLVSEYRSGEVVWDRIPTTMRHHPDVGRRIGFAVVDALAELHQADPHAPGLAELGRPEGYLARQVAGWLKRWTAVAEGDAADITERVGRELARSIPENSRIAVVHNDFKIDNCQFDPANPDRVKSVFDWDMATIGDPMTDLGSLLFYWPDLDPEVPSVLPGIGDLGLPSKDEVIARYATHSDLTLEQGELDWYEAFGCWKTAVIMQQLYMRFVRGETTDPRMAGRGEKVKQLSERALTLLTSS